MGGRSSGVDKATQKFYRTWSLMKDRCNNVNTPTFSEYGARGIRVCVYWETFSNFYNDMYASFIEHVLKHGLGSGTTLERVDNEGMYSKENCRWATMKEQANNRRSSVFITFGGMKLTLCQWAEKTGINRRTITQRIKSGWSLSRALTK